MRARPSCFLECLFAAALAVFFATQPAPAQVAYWQNAPLPPSNVNLGDPSYVSVAVYLENATPLPKYVVQRLRSFVDQGYSREDAKAMAAAELQDHDETVLLLALYEDGRVQWASAEDGATTYTSQNLLSSSEVAGLVEDCRNTDISNFCLPVNPASLPHPPLQITVYMRDEQGASFDAFANFREIPVDPNWTAIYLPSFVTMQDHGSSVKEINIAEYRTRSQLALLESGALRSGDAEWLQMMQRLTDIVPPGD